MNRILTANENALVVRFGGYRQWIEREASRRMIVYPNWHLNKMLAPVLAQVERSTWVWVCECGAMWWAEPTFPRAWCAECRNEKSGGFSRLIVFPKDRRAIERALVDRPVKNRNWLPFETVQDLINENVVHGV